MDRVRTTGRLPRAPGSLVEPHERVSSRETVSVSSLSVKDWREMDNIISGTVDDDVDEEEV